MTAAKAPHPGSTLDDELLPINLDAVEAAARRIAPHVHRTPVLRSRLLDGRTGARVLLKAECLQRTGSFKARGAFNAVLAGAERGDGRGIIALSSGNHAQAVALAAATAGLAATVVMPGDASALKRAATRAYGAAVISEEVDAANREAMAQAVARERGLRLVHPFDDPEVMAGQGTVALELLEQAAASGVGLDAILVPVGGGGLLSGVATAVRALAPGVRIIGVEPARADDAARSLATGRLQRLAVAPDTIADGVRTLSLGERPWAVIRRLVDAIVTVDEDAIATACWWLWTRAKLVVEPTGALPLAALLAAADGAHPAGPLAALLPPSPTVGCVLSGGNVDPLQLATLVRRPPDAVAQPGG
ncbi:MAG TPA: threonine/serine dehydratase [Candidatus Dormibacteraeota bacterium]|nr:threonine/serine dehydratase [Candidatus Dormibacteraeota bacterium]